MSSAADRVAPEDREDLIPRTRFKAILDKHPSTLRKGDQVAFLRWVPRTEEICVQDLQDSVCTIEFQDS